MHLQQSEVRVGVKVEYISRSVIYDRIRSSMTDRTAWTAAAGSRSDLGLRLIDDFDDDLADGTIARSPAGILSFLMPCSYTRSRNSSSGLGGPRWRLITAKYANRYIPANYGPPRHGGTKVDLQHRSRYIGTRLYRASSLVLCGRNRELAHFSWYHTRLERTKKRLIHI